MRCRVIHPEVFVEARRFDVETWEDLSAWLPKDLHMFVASPGRMSLHLAGDVLDPGDWIVKDDLGHYQTFKAFELPGYLEAVDEDGEPIPQCEACAITLDPDNYKTDSEGVRLCDDCHATL